MLHGYFLRSLSRCFHSLLGEFLGYILLSRGQGFFPLGYIQPSHLAKTFGHSMILLLLEALGFLDICRWFRPRAHGLGFLGLDMSLCRFYCGAQSSWTQGKDDSSFLGMDLGFLDREWTYRSLFGDIPCFLNIGSKQLGLLKCELGLL